MSRRTGSPAAGMAADTLPPIRARPIPDREPPLLTPQQLAQILDEVRNPSPYVQGTLAVELDTRSGRDEHDERFFGPQPTSAGLLPDPQAWAMRLARAVLEVVDGARPVTQLMRWTSPEVYDALAKRHLRSVRRGGAQRSPVVRRVMVCEPVDGVAEVSVAVHHGGRVRAMALRLEGLDHRWVLTVLQIG